MGAKAILGALFIIVVLILFGVYYFRPLTELEFTANPLNYNFSLNGNASNIQFYPNMRFEDGNISYKLENCNIKKTEEMTTAFDIMENLTILSFYEVQDHEQISVACNESVKFKESMFIAGEGGPTGILRSGNYNIILGGSILLFRSSECPSPNVAIHELLHVLGFIHSDNPNNIMYNYTKCLQTVGDEIVNVIDEVYSTPSIPDLSFENASANMKSRYLNLNFSIKNIGLSNSEATDISIIMNDDEIEKIDLKELEAGTGVEIIIENLFIKNLGLGDLELVINYDKEELSKVNNKLILKLS